MAIYFRLYLILVELPCKRSVLCLRKVTPVVYSIQRETSRRIKPLFKCASLQWNVEMNASLQFCFLQKIFFSALDFSLILNVHVPVQCGSFSLPAQLLAQGESRHSLNNIIFNPTARKQCWPFTLLGTRKMQYFNISNVANQRFKYTLIKNISKWMSHIRLAEKHNDTQIMLWSDS